MVVSFSGGKIIVILLLLWYTAALRLGFWLFILYYCMNELVGWTLWHHSDKEKCGKCGMVEKKAGCCKDEHKSLAKNQHQKGDVAKLDSTCFISSYCSSSVYNYSDKYLPYRATSNFPSGFSCAPLQGTPLFIQYCVFRFDFAPSFCQHHLSVPGYLYFSILYLKFITMKSLMMMSFVLFSAASFAQIKIAKLPAWKCTAIVICELKLKGRNAERYQQNDLGICKTELVTTITDSKKTTSDAVFEKTALAGYDSDNF